MKDNNKTNYTNVTLLVRLRMTAFTLAETLITLGIIGIVAAMTIPTLISNYQKKQTVTKLQKAISVVNQAYRLAYDDVGEATPQEAFDMSTSKYFEKYWAPYLKVSLYCTSMSQCGYKENQPYRHKNITRQAEVYMVDTRTRTTFYTPDGFLYVIMVSGGTTPTAQSSIWVDINGASKPNVIGKDLFILRRKIDGEKGGVVVPDCYDKTDDYVNSECLNGNNFCCAEKIKRAGWKIDKSYQWK